MASSLKAGARPCHKIWFLYLIFFYLDMFIYVCLYLCCICLFVFVCLCLGSIFSAQQMIKPERWRRLWYLDAIRKVLFQIFSSCIHKSFYSSIVKKVAWGGWAGPAVCDGLWRSVMDTSNGKTGVKLSYFQSPAVSPHILHKSNSVITFSKSGTCSWGWTHQICCIFRQFEVVGSRDTFSILISLENKAY